MAGSEAEPAKLLLPYLQRADELQKHEPLVAYYCRLYAMEKGLKIPQKERTKTTNALLMSLIKQLEKDKKALKFAPEDSLYVEGFASKLFAKADKQDRDGRADLNTAKTFYAASIFFEILNQFGELHPDIEQKQKYAIWKAADIRKAIKEGRKPVPGPPGGDEDETLSSENDTHDLGASDNFSSNRQDFSSPHMEDQNFQRNENLSSSSYRPADVPPQHSDRLSPQDFSQTNRVDPQDFGRRDRVNPQDFGRRDSVGPQDFGRTDSVGPQDFGQAPGAPSYSSPDYPTNDYHQQLPPTGRPDYSAFPQHYDHEPYAHEQQSAPSNHYPENTSPSFSYPNFQSYPSFHESTFPSVPTEQPSYYHGPDTSAHLRQSSPPSNYSSAVHYSSTGGSANHVESNTAAAEAYHYDSNYQPSVEKIAESLKSARFAVGSLAFDDVSTAVEHLRRSLELLTNPSAKIH